MKYPFLATVWAFVIGVGCDNTPSDRVYEYTEIESPLAAGDVGEFGPCRYDAEASYPACRIELAIKAAPTAGAWEYSHGTCGELFPTNLDRTALLTVSSDQAQLRWVRYMDCPKGARSTCTAWTDGQGYPSATWRVECRR